MTRPLSACAIVVVLFAASHARATNYYLSTSGGNDSNAGTSEASPWQTVAPLEDVTLHPGDHVYFKAGESFPVTNHYATSGWDPGIWPQAESSGAEGNPVTFTSYGSGAMPILYNPNDHEGASCISLRASYVVIDSLAFANTRDAAIVIEETASHVTVQNCETNRVGAGVTVYGEYATITHNYFHDGTMIHNTMGGDDDYGANGVVASGSYLEISYNRAVHLQDFCYDFGEDGGFVELYGGFHDVNVHHNIVSDTGGFVEGGSGSNLAQDRLTFAYNVSINNKDLTVMHNGGDHFAAVYTNVLYINNTVIDTTGTPTEVWFSTAATEGSFEFRNNIFWSPGGRIYQNAGAVAHSNNLYPSGVNLGLTMGGDEITGDPGFVDAAGGDYHLTAGSSAVDHGSATVFAFDFDGTAVPTGGSVDIGAYEYSATGPMDGGVGLVDASAIDWGAPGTDAGLAHDAGLPVLEAGTPLADGGVATMDAGVAGGAAPASGCDVAGAQSTKSPFTLLVFVVACACAVGVRRRRS